jgi:hypothetical protein
MPGYKSLPEQFSGAAADRVRYAEVLQRAGANDDAVRLLETTLEACITSSPELPGWLCGRLAALYRTMKRYDDEVRLLERYRDSQRSEEARTRFDARLSKARAIAERKRRTETRAIASVRIAARRKTEVPVPIGLSDEDCGFSADTLATVRESLTEAAQKSNHDGLETALLRLRDEAIKSDHSPERLVTTLRAIWRGATRPADCDAAVWDAVYRDSLTRSLSMYFDEQDA